jgi:hypothetical protein
MNFNINVSEKDLEDFLVSNIQKYHPDLKIIKRQFITSCGIIDLLAKDTSYGDNVYAVIELKIGELDASAVCQVLRYTQYLNSEMSKKGKRFFYPLLIGSSISEEISKLVCFFNDEYNDTFYCMYDLFSFDLKGINFGYYNINNLKFFRENFIEQNSRCENFGEEIVEKDFEIYNLKTKIEDLEKRKND